MLDRFRPTADIVRVYRPTSATMEQDQLTFSLISSRVLVVADATADDDDTVLRFL